MANLCVNTDHSLLAALAYAVNVLEVRENITVYPWSSLDFLGGGELLLPFNPRFLIQRLILWINLLNLPL